ncbi:hypothetical protein NF556_07950 [Ornithinimicrobium faecis]|uniref:DUF7662 domain-containing protein n=1 Tax=Ornithinimicrobium faecis TaxID=2934158 RepID=A0ABY4YXR0_9MICO|nr:hypothetical protein [Ornithinimicrobium sp. HY1793]USQ81566.1 hypothetical protein NF556_07950 [Ornithinimicrobium sp. HY1793]
MVTEQQGASDLNRELTRLLSSVGESFGFAVVPEYPVRGGRLDVVWTWAPPSEVPGLDTAIPVVGFEIESSWRTRKHVKGDLLNLQDAGVGLGVIVLAGDSDKDESLRRFAVQLVDRPGTNVLVWTAEDVRVLAQGAAGVEGILGSRPAALRVVLAAKDGRTTSPLVGTSSTGSALAKASYAGKYAALHRWLRTRTSPSVSVTFAEVEEVLGFPLPSSCRNHVAHWHSYEGSAVTRAILDAGWKADKVDLDAQTVRFVRDD